MGRSRLSLVWWLVLSCRFLTGPARSQLSWCWLETTELVGVPICGVSRLLRASKDVGPDHVELIGVPESDEGHEPVL